MIYVIRHGQTALNSAHALQGRSDAPLNETGEEQAREAARQLAARGIVFRHVFSSPLQRAVQTAELVAPGVPVQCDERLIEMDYGPYEGIDLKSPPPEIITFFSDFVHNLAPEGMEQLADVVAQGGCCVGHYGRHFCDCCFEQERCYLRTRQRFDGSRHGRNR